MVGKNILKIKNGTFILIFCFLTILFAGCSRDYCEDSPCEWCQSEKTRKVDKEDGGICYVCENCYTHCIYCGKKVTKHYSSVTGNEVFTCDECFEIDMQMMYDNGIRNVEK